MFKKLILFSTIAILGGCETINQTNQCDPDKNYIISNPQAMEEYKTLRKSGEINSFYVEVLPASLCNTNTCIKFDNNKFSYIERLFNDSERNGVYTITAHKDSEGRTCMKESASTIYEKNRLCYEAIKNDNNIKSKYKYTYDRSKKDQTIVNVVDMKNNKSLYEYSYQIYSHKGIGGPAIGTCPSSNNNPEYKFNSISFLMDN